MTENNKPTVANRGFLFFQPTSLGNLRRVDFELCWRNMFGVFRGFLRKDLIHSFIGSEKMTDGWQTKSTPSGAFCLIQGELDFNCRVNLFHRFTSKITKQFTIFQGDFWQQG